MNNTKGEWEVNNIKFGKWLIQAHDGIVAAIEPTGLIQMASCEANAHLIAAAPEMYEACNAIDRYFKACVIAWAANDGKLVNDRGNAIAEADGLDELSDIAANLAVEALAKAEGGS